MRRRALPVLGFVVGVLLIVGGVLYGTLSSAGPVKSKLPPPVAMSTDPTPTVRSSATPTAPASPHETATQKPTTSLPRGKPDQVAVSRRGKQFIREHISGSVGLIVQDGKNTLVPPRDSVAWYKEGRWRATPGYPGPSVLVAHISYHGDPGPFWRLPDVAVGDRITVTYSSGDTVTFVVTAIDRLPKDELPTDKIWNPTREPVLRLITCDPDTPFHAGHYAGNVIVYADRLVLG